MALLWFDGMDRYDSLESFINAYPSSGPVVEFTAGRFGGRSLKLPKTFGANVFTPPSFVNSSSLILNFAIKLGGRFSNFPILYFSSGANPSAYKLKLTSSGQLEFYINNILFNYTKKSLAYDTWTHIELYFRIGSGVGGGTNNGYLELRVNEEEFMKSGTLNGSQTLNTSANLFSSINGISFRSSDANATDVYLDDISIMNDQGSINNGFHGDSVIENFVPTGNSLSAWSSYPQGNQTWQSVSEIPPDFDNSYAFTSSNNTFERYTSRNPQYAVQSVYGLRVVALAKKDNSDFAAAIPFFNNTLVGTYEGPQYPLTTGYQYYSMQVPEAPSSVQGFQGPTSNIQVSTIQGFNFGLKFIEA